jgi:hypothetical protein
MDTYDCREERDCTVMHKTMSAENKRMIVGRNHGWKRCRSYMRQNTIRGGIGTDFNEISVCCSAKKNTIK